MKLRITDYGWGIDRKSGERSESVVAEVTLDVEKVGALPPVGPARHVFKVLEIKEGAVEIFLSEKSGSVVLELGKPYEYRPMSFDGGHFYRLELE